MVSFSSWLGMSSRLPDTDPKPANATASGEVGELSIFLRCERGDHLRFMRMSDKGEMARDDDDTD